MPMFAILICKLAAFAGRLLGRGSSLPGALALKVNRRILSQIKLPPIVVAVTGSNGKTSTTELIRCAGLATGKKVICNSEGSNQIEGVATVLLRNCRLNGTVDADIAVLECDERFCQHIFKFFTPTCIVITNLFRDQLTRNGSSEYVAGELRRGLREGSTLIVNADEPVSCALAADRPSVIRYSVTAKELREKKKPKHVYDDGRFCPVCQTPLRYSWRNLSHLGRFRCPNCSFGPGKIAHAVTGCENGVFLIDKNTSVKPQIGNVFYSYNIAAAFTVAVEMFGLSAEQAASALSGYNMSNHLIDRVIDFRLGEHAGRFFLSKHENSMSWNGSLRTMIESDSQQLSVCLIVDLLSRKYVANDMSWLWDIDFEQLCDPKISKVFLGGLFAHDVALRLIFAGVDPDRIAVDPDLDDMMARLSADAEGDIYLLTCFTDIPKFQQRLKKMEES